ncbi:restriction endonuclease subunit S [Galbibacter sp. EGI 63066]|uniref:restriction endonuclease subunit S n=1 Tax=Galbibacter sp. EGI 63066 TaxID=2993559 RepID=UPI0022489938|nr:restriction endonuclease subunit S [Galbibacter sp. EGI 63066]MCX2681464.1 restriction endonuclease subunit S [Galbibacter sp. EGI 63066]
MTKQDWAECCFQDLLDYEQPTRYIVKSTKYNDSYKTPVLTAGKTFIKGYTNETDGVFDNLPTIIFDDFTTASQFVNFKFKVKSSAMKILVPTSKLVNIPFVYYAMQVNQVRSDTHKRYWISVFSKKKFLLPPLPEKHAIVQKIETLFSSLDNGIADLKKAQDQLKTYRQAVLKKAFEGIEELVPLNECGEWKGGGTPSKRINEYWENGDIPWVSSRDVKTKEIHDTERHITELAIPNSSTKWIEKESLLFVMRSGILRRIFPIAIAKRRLCVNQDIQTVFLNENWYSEYVYWYLLGNESDIRHSCSKDGTTVESIDANSLKSYQVPLCSIQEQHRIVHEIESRLSVCDAVEQNIADSLEKAQALRQSILKKAFEGKLLSEEEIAKCKQHKDYEPASVLLEKIKAEKNKNKE